MYIKCASAIIIGEFQLNKLFKNICVGLKFCNNGFNIFQENKIYQLNGICIIIPEDLLYLTLAEKLI